jgi:hypothetical protein
VITDALDRVVFLRLNRFVTVYAAGLGLSLFLFLNSVLETARQGERRSVAPLSVGLSERRCYKWRAERNFWISAFSLVLWLILYKFRQLVKQARKNN